MSRIDMKDEWKKIEMRATQVIESEARGASRGQRNHMSHEKSSTSPCGRKRKRVRKKSDALVAAVTQGKISKNLT